MRAWASSWAWNWPSMSTVTPAGSGVAATTGAHLAHHLRQTAGGVGRHHDAPPAAVAAIWLGPRPPRCAQAWPSGTLPSGVATGSVARCWGRARRRAGGSPGRSAARHPPPRPPARRPPGAAPRPAPGPARWRGGQRRVVQHHPQLRDAHLLLHLQVGDAGHRGKARAGCRPGRGSRRGRRRSP